MVAGPEIIRGQLNDLLEVDVDGRDLVGALDQMHQPCDGLA